VQINGSWATIPTSPFFPVICAAIAIGIFIADTITPAEFAFGVLYVSVVLLAARFLQWRGIVLATLGCMALTLLSHVLSPHQQSLSIAVANSLLSLATISVASFLAVQSQSRELVLRDQAGLLDLTHDTIFARDMNDVIFYWNRGAEELYGWKKREAVGKVTHQLLRTVFPMPLEEITAGLVRTGRWQGELVHPKKDGTPAIVASRWSLQRDARGHPVAILETNNDITALRAAQAELAHINRVTTMGQLTASIAHEVSQPIAAVVTNADAALNWLRAQPPNLDEVRHTLGQIVDDGHRAGHVIDRIRALIKKTPPRKNRFDLNEAILDVIALARSEALKHGVSLQTGLATGLPSVDGDRIQLQQVILNLVLNAVEAMRGIDEGARAVLISTEADAAGGVLVSVRDSGMGLDPSNADRLFEAFYTTKPEGLGMGLAICRSIIAAHGGLIWASANKPRGAVFQFTLPRESDETARAEPAGHMPVV
jgi:two-component system sensor kinase FixL